MDELVDSTIISRLLNRILLSKVLDQSLLFVKCSMLHSAPGTAEGSCSGKRTIDSFGRGSQRAGHSVSLTLPT